MATPARIWRLTTVYGGIRANPGAFDWIAGPARSDVRGEWQSEEGVRESHKFLGVAPWATIGIGGWAGFATRRTTLSGSDAYFDNALGHYNDTSTVFSSNSSVTPFIANAEAGVALRPLPGWIVRGFVGVNYDDKVPGISPASFAIAALGATPDGPAAISFHSETSYYAGGGITWTFTPAIP